VLSHGTWQRRYGGSADVIGRTLEVNEVARTIVGVLGPEFEPLIDGARPEVWLPYVPRPNQAETSDAHVLDVAARLAPGASFAIAAAQLEAWNDELSATNSTYVQRGIVVESLEQRWLGPVRTPLLFLLAGSLIVLAVACVNLGILFAARNASRQREVAVRRAIGADLRDLASPVITEVAIVALIGTFVGVVIAWFLSSAITAVVPAELPRFEGIRPSLRSLLFCATIAIAATLLVAAWPVARAMRLPAAAALRSRAAGETGGVWRSRVLIAMETAAVIVLLVGASLATRGFVSLMRMDPGFTPEGRISFDVTASVADVPAAERMQRMTGTFEAARQAVLNVPGVEAAGVVTNLPLTPASWGGDLRIDCCGPDNNVACRWSAITNRG
jgi:hypothetical protein